MLPLSTPYHHIAKGLLFTVLLVQYIMSICQVMKRHTKKQKRQFVESINIRAKHGRNVGITRQGFATITLSKLRSLMDKVDNKIRFPNRDVEILRKN